MPSSPPWCRPEAMAKKRNEPTEAMLRTMREMGCPGDPRVVWASMPEDAKVGVRKVTRHRTNGAASLAVGERGSFFVGKR